MFVVDASTLILLAKVSVLEVFMKSAPPLIIPYEVKDEVERGTSFDVRLITKAIRERKIRVKRANQKMIPTIMQEFRIDIGEAAAYALYNRNKHDAILTDDREMMKICKLDGIPFLCAMAIVLRLNEKGKLTQQETLVKMQKLVEVGRYSENIYDHFVSEVR